MMGMQELSPARRGEHRTDLGDGRCTIHPCLCMIPGCDHSKEPQATRDGVVHGHFRAPTFTISADGTVMGWAAIQAN